MTDTIMFDMGGTLEDIWYNEETTAQAAERVMEMLADAACAVRRTKEEFRAGLFRGIAAYKKWSEAVCKELKPDEIWTQYYLKEFALPDDMVAAISEELAGMWEVTYFHRELRPNVKETLLALRKKGYRIGVISNTASLYSVFDVLEAYGIRDLIDSIALSSVTGYRKPHPEIFRIALRQMHADPKTCAYVGDTISRDVRGAVLAGFGRTIQIPSFLSGEKDKGTDPKWKPDDIIQEISDLQGIF